MLPPSSFPVHRPVTAACLWALVLVSLGACGGDESAAESAEATEPAVPVGRGEAERGGAPEALPAEAGPEWAVALHAGGVAQGVDPTTRLEALEAVLQDAAELLDGGRAALDVVEAVAIALEDDPRFNAGRGANFTQRGTHELDASIMDGRSGLAGAVASLRNIRNPVQLAREQLERSSAVLVTADAAEKLSRAARTRRAPQNYFTTPARLRQWQRDRRRRGSDGNHDRTALDHPSVGVVAFDRYGNLAAAASSGGPSDRPAGELTAASVIGAAAWADNREGAVAAWGEDGELIRGLPAVRVAAALAGAPPSASGDSSVELLPAGDESMGLVAIDAVGRILTAVRGPGMLLGFTDSTGRLTVARGGNRTGASGRPSPTEIDPPSQPSGGGP